MHYIYDILLNYNSEAYEFFEWDNKDEFSHIRKIPFYKINTNDLFDLINNKVQIDSEFISKIYKKTEVFNKNRVISIDYSFLATDKKEVVAFKLDKDGNVIKYSKLLPNEEDEVIEYSYSISPYKINYKVVKNIKKNNFITRNELKIRDYIFKEINKIIKNNDIDKLNYMYLECFEKTPPKDIKYNFLKELNNNWDNNYYKIYKFLKVIFTKR